MKDDARALLEKYVSVGPYNNTGLLWLPTVCEELGINEDRACWLIDTKWEEHFDYGTSPRGAWLTPEGYEWAIARLKERQ